MKKITGQFLLYFITITTIFFSGCNQPETKKVSSNRTHEVVQTIGYDEDDSTNNFYDNAETYDLALHPLFVGGEVIDRGEVDFSKLTLHSVIVKEASSTENGDKFIGAYRYDGYSLFDILNHRTIDKSNAGEFEPVIDLYVEIENEEGEKVIVSWGEIYYPNHLHDILIASRVMRIVPSKTNDLWPLPKDSKLVVADDLITERNISSPTKITVKSYPKSFEVTRHKKPLFSPKVDFIAGNEILFTLDSEPENFPVTTYESIFYGRGRGIHSTQPFHGIMLKLLLEGYVSKTVDYLRKGMILVVADDGYRCIFSLSEVMNRNDHSEILLIHQSGEEDGGAFRLFPACDFFSDRAIKAISEIYIETPE